MNNFEQNEFLEIDSYVNYPYTMYKTVPVCKTIENKKIDNCNNCCCTEKSIVDNKTYNVYLCDTKKKENNNVITKCREITDVNIIEDIKNKSEDTFSRIAKDTKLDTALKMIVDSVNDEIEDELFYSTLLNQAIEATDKTIIQSIRDDEIKHRKLLRDVYFNITGINLPEPRNEKDFSANTYLKNLEKALQSEVKAAEKYRIILNSMPDKQNYNIIMEILIDELRHADSYNYLIAKNL